MAKVYFYGTNDVASEPVFIDEWDGNATVVECELCGSGIDVGDDAYRINGGYYCRECVDVGEVGVDDEDEGVPDPWC